VNSSPDWDAYRVLLRVVERGSFSRAAAELAMSQPTASRRVDELERALGARLLVRRARGVVPTPAGERVVAEAKRMALSATAASRMATGELAPTTRRVRISATEGLGVLWLPPRVQQLRANDPQLAIELVIDNLATDLSARQADIAIRLFKPRQPDLVAKNVGTLGFGFYAAPSYLADRAPPRRLADLAKHDHVGYIDRGVAAPPYQRWLRKLVPEERFVASSSSLLGMIELARAGQGIVLSTAALLDDNLERLLPRARPPSMDIWLAAHVDVRRDPDVAAVFDRLAAIFADEAAQLATGAGRRS
jgi:DNA-binding transcriptional LysR family regulator